jgi:hypothetical protein
MREKVLHSERSIRWTYYSQNQTKHTMTALASTPADASD